jgi:hypothetical protein
MDFPVPADRRRRLTALVGAGLAVLATSLVLLLSSAQPASASYFCQGAYINPGANCWGVAIQGLDYAEVYTWERAGCAAVMNTSNVVVAGWRCGPASGGGYLTAQVWGPMSLTNWYKAVILNNNFSRGGYFRGGYNCVQGC